jgi:hypothetical protein
MGLETATYINTLDSAQPAATDPVGQGDDHIRLIKGVLKATFPNITGPVTATQNQLNAPFPIGAIVLWYGTIETIPSGWALCNGQTVTRTDGGGSLVTPNMVDKFVKGTGTTASVGTTGGAATATTAAAGAATVAFTTSVAGSHRHGGVTSGTYLTESHLPAHTHVSAGTRGGGSVITQNGNFFGSSNNYILEAGGNPSSGAIYTSSTGGGAAHNHEIPLESGHSHSGTVTLSNHTHTVSTEPSHVMFAYIIKY